MDGLIIWSAFGDPIIIALIFGAFACGVIAWMLAIATRRTRSAGRNGWELVARISYWVFVTVCGFHVGAVLSGVGEIDASRYAHVLTTLQTRPQMVQPFVQAMADGRMSTVEYWSVRRHGGLIDDEDMRDVSARVAKALRTTR